MPKRKKQRYEVGSEDPEFTAARLLPPEWEVAGNEQLPGLFQIQAPRGQWEPVGMSGQESVFFPTGEMGAVSTMGPQEYGSATERPEDVQREMLLAAGELGVEDLPAYMTNVRTADLRRAREDSAARNLQAAIDTNDQERQRQYAMWQTLARRLSRAGLDSRFNETTNTLDLGSGEQFDLSSEADLQAAQKLADLYRERDAKVQTQPPRPRGMLYVKP